MSCAIPICNNSKKHTPEKFFFVFPVAKKLRKRWCRSMGAESEYLGKSSFVCEDHFNFEKDLENYMKVRLMNATPILKKSAVPNLLLRYEESPVEVRRSQKRVVEELLEDAASTECDGKRKVMADAPLKKIDINVRESTSNNSSEKVNHGSASYSCRTCQRIFSSQRALATHSSECIMHLGFVHTSGLESAPNQETYAPIQEPNSPIQEPNSPIQEPNSPIQEPNSPIQEPNSPIQETNAPARKTNAPARKTNAPAQKTNTPAQRTNAPAQRTNAPAQRTNAPAQRTNAPALRTNSPAQRTNSPAQRTNAPAQKTNAPVEETNDQDTSSIEILYEKVIADESWLVTSLPKGYECADAMFVMEAEGTCMLQQEIPVVAEDPENPEEILPTLHSPEGMSPETSTAPSPEPLEENPDEILPAFHCPQGMSPETSTAPSPEPLEENPEEILPTLHSPEGMSPETSAAPSPEPLEENVVVRWAHPLLPNSLECEEEEMEIMEDKQDTVVPWTLPLLPDSLATEEEIEIMEDKQCSREILPDVTVSPLEERRSVEQELPPPWSINLLPDALEPEEEKEIMEYKLVLEPRMMLGTFICVRGEPTFDVEEDPLAESPKDPLEVIEHEVKPERVSNHEVIESQSSAFVSVPGKPAYESGEDSLEGGAEASELQMMEGSFFCLRGEPIYESDEDPLRDAVQDPLMDLVKREPGSCFKVKKEEPKVMNEQDLIANSPTTDDLRFVETQDPLAISEDNVKHETVGVLKFGCR